MYSFLSSPLFIEHVQNERISDWPILIVVVNKTRVAHVQKIVGISS